MNKRIKYTKTILLLITSLLIIEYLVMSGAGPARYQYHQFKHGTVLKILVDFLRLLIVLLFIIKVWHPEKLDNFYIVLALLYIIPTSLDLWVWWVYGQWPYLIYITIYSFPIIIILHHYLINKEIKIKTYFIFGCLLMILGFAFEYFFMNYKDITLEDFDKVLNYQKFRNALFYLGSIFLFFGLTGTIKILKHRNTV